MSFLQENGPHGLVAAKTTTTDLEEEEFSEHVPLPDTVGSEINNEDIVDAVVGTHDALSHVDDDEIDVHDAPTVATTHDASTLASTNIIASTPSGDYFSTIAENEPQALPVVTTTNTVDKEEVVFQEASKITEENESNELWEPAEYDVLSGRGAHVNAHPGNKKFRALCFARKAQFEAGNHAAKRRIATEIWNAMVQQHQSRYLKKRLDKGPWHEMSAHEAILKAQQVIRDYQRPDRIRDHKKQNRATATPMDDVPVPPPPIEPIIEHPEGVTDSDVLCGRGAFVNGHSGNQRLRKFAAERKAEFDAGSYTEKRALALEIVVRIKTLDPPGRFMRKAKPNEATDSEWVEVDSEKAIHKACQVMRDIDRPDRRARDERRRLKKMQKVDGNHCSQAPQIPLLEEVKEIDSRNEAGEPEKQHATEHDFQAI